MIGTVGKFFKNLLNLSTANYTLKRMKLDDINLNQNRTAGLSYEGYEKNNNLNFSTFRTITVSEKTKVDIKIEFKQYEFNKDLSFPFNIPRNFKTK
jgi:outer membrane lipoprotein-sorting protein